MKPLSTRPPLREYLRELWRRRAFAVSMSAGEFQARHANTVLGGFWYLLNPLLQLSVYWLVFGVVLGINRGVENFVGFLAAGIFVFAFSQRAITGGAKSISSNLNLIRSLQFPRGLLPLSAVLGEAMTLRLALIVAAAILLITGEPLTFWWLLVLPVLALQFCFNVGGALIAARLADKIKDIENVLPFLFRLLFYASGVLFLADRYLADFENPDLWRPWFILNPLYSFLSLIRHYTMETISQEHVELMWLSAGGWSLVMLVGGLLFFRAGENTYGRG